MRPAVSPCARPAVLSCSARSLGSFRPLRRSLLFITDGEAGREHRQAAEGWVRTSVMSTATAAIAERETEAKTTLSAGSGHGELLRKNLRCSACGGALPAGTPIGTLMWGRESRRFRHARSCSATAPPKGEAGSDPVTGPAPEPAQRTDSPPQYPKTMSPSEKLRPSVLTEEGSGEPGAEAGRDWARIGFTLRLAEFESLRAEIALYAAPGEADSKFTERLRESLILKAQEALAAVQEVREWLSKGRVKP